MGTDKKTAKGRLDKYYHLAKDQGYRARSAFKLIQLNKKYNFLADARVCIDLCAAPGGWLQVAAKEMPPNNIIIGVDLAPIKPINGVITMINDITTDKCRADIRKELKHMRADVVLHDGAPNVGKSWIQDAYSQAELTLSALKLATDFLRPNGTFVTKVFRSKDYAALLATFGQIFERVDATKPASSRNVSAEIFVVCRRFKGVSDPKLTDPRHVFAELVQPSTAGKVDIMHPEKRRRHRDGYEDDATMLFKTVEAMEFFDSQDPISILSTVNQIKLSGSEGHLDEEIREYCRDLKVLGRKEYKALLKWRLANRKDRAPKSPGEEGDKPEAPLVIDDPLAELEDMENAQTRQQKREKRKQAERQARAQRRMDMGVADTTDLAEGLEQQTLFSLKSLKKRTRMDQTVEAEEDENETEAGSDKESSSSSEDGDSEEGAERWAEQLEDSYRQHKQERLRKDALKFVAEEKRKGEKDLDAEDLEAVEDLEMAEDEKGEAYSSDSESEADLVTDLQRPEERKSAQLAKTAAFYSNPLFKVLDEMLPARPKDIAGVAAEVGETLKKSKKQEKKANKKGGKKEKEEDEEDGKEIVFVKAAPELDFDDETKAELLNSGEGMSMAMRLVADRKKAKEELIDESFNRYAFNDDRASLPAWFLEDEAHHNRPQKPITKEVATMLKERQKLLDARPIKKVLEARGRNRMRAMRKLETLRRKAAVIAESEELGEKDKGRQIERLLSKKPKQERKETKLVISKGGRKGLKGRPKGVKGHYKMVDRRMLKEKRAEKRQKTKKGGNRRK